MECIYHRKVSSLLYYGPDFWNISFQLQCIYYGTLSEFISLLYIVCTGKNSQSIGEKTTKRTMNLDVIIFILKRKRSRFLGIYYYLYLIENVIDFQWPGELYIIY